jgi:hypothetical protein
VAFLAPGRRPPKPQIQPSPRILERAASRDLDMEAARAEPRARVRAYVSGLAAGLERKNGWTLAEQAGEAGPDGMQRLLRRADWDVDGVRDDVRG